MQVAAMSAPPPTRADYYGYPEHTQRMGAPTMMAGQTTAIPPYQRGGGYGDYGGDGEPPRSWARRWLPWLVGLLVVIAAVIVAAMLLLNNGKSYFVPQVDGLPLNQAEQQITTAHLKVGPVIQQNSASVPKGDVISTNPANGNSAAQNSVVTIYESSGQAKVTVPPLQGDTTAQAEQALSKLNLQYTLATDTQSTQPQGTVDHTNPPGGTSVQAGSTVKLFVSGGGAPVPEVTGIPVNSAVQELTNSGFTDHVVTTPGPPGTQPGLVWNQNPTSQTMEPKGFQVTIYVQPQATSSPSPSNSPSPSSTSPSPSTTGNGSPPGNGNGNGILPPNNP
jgi:eukaryotic-like serine/threonine-protein kinase